MSPKAIDVVNNYDPVTEDETVAIPDPIQHSNIDPATPLKHNTKSNFYGKSFTNKHPTTTFPTSKLLNEVSSDGNLATPGTSNFRKNAITPQKNSMGAGLGITVPSPFKRNLFWPDSERSKNKKRIKREKMPSAVTSKA
ncbi:hypothetical protein HHI36_010538 [Cryptolaemus montrouzieri]|uniref:Uncharacterized protein n=1 Tax=Cryptolaemus montrouzieri TaxID=559131 RepID=A0ABD2MIZ6_9CUCU